MKLRGSDRQRPNSHKVAAPNDFRLQRRPLVSPEHVAHAASMVGGARGADMPQRCQLGRDSSQAAALAVFAFGPVTLLSTGTTCDNAWGRLKPVPFISIPRS